MPLNLDKLIFHSNNTPYGTVFEAVRRFNWQGVITSIGDELLSEEIKIPTKNIFAKVLIKTPTDGSWRVLFADVVGNNESFYNSTLVERYSATFIGNAEPIVKRTANGLRFGIRRSWSVESGPLTGTRTLPSREFELKLVVDILPRIEGII